MDGGALYRKTIKRYLRQLCREAGVTEITPHTLRQTFGTEMVRAGIPLPRVQKLMGHESPATTALYAEVAASDLQETMAKAAPWHQQHGA